MSRLIQNSIHIFSPDIYLNSISVDDYSEHLFPGLTEPGTGRTLGIGIQGGLEFPQRVGPLYDVNRLGLYEEWCITDEDPFEPVIVDRLLSLWTGSWRPIKNLDAGSLYNFHYAFGDIDPLIREVVTYWYQRKPSFASAPQ
jgi:hypothetical protein